MITSTSRPVDTLNGKIGNFLLADRSLPTLSVSNLLLSSSFGINAVFYAAWLGYMMGMWAIVIHSFWALSFVLLSLFHTKFSSLVSLHDAVGQSFGLKAKLAASLCSLIGIAYFIGWEVAIARDIFASVSGASNAISLELSEFILAAIIATAFAYTFLGGILANARTNKALNLAKICSMLVVCTAIFIGVAPQLVGGAGGKLLFPTVDDGLLALGAFGLATNLLFNAAWQFVDNSTWQSVIAGSKEGSGKVKKDLVTSGVLVLSTIGLLGTVLGASARLLEGSSADSIFTSILTALPGFELLVAWALIILISACVMSLIDGMLLAATLTITVDIATAISKRKVSLGFGRAILVVFGLTAIFGVELLITKLGGNIFDFVYVLILSQLAIIGPVVFALLGKKDQSGLMVFPILAALFVGFGMVFYGSSIENSLFVDGAGSATIATSLFASALVLLLTSRFAGDNNKSGQAP